LQAQKSAYVSGVTSMFRGINNDFSKINQTSVENNNNSLQKEVIQGPIKETVDKIMSYKTLTLLENNVPLQ
jgi:hypothetical protein